MADIIISGIVAALTICACCCYLKFEQIKMNRTLKELLPKNIVQALFGTGMIISSIAIITMLSLLYDVSWMFTIKRIIVCTVLWPIALIDYRKHIIPNKIIGAMIISRVAIAVVELISDWKTAKTELLSCLIAAVGILAILCLMRFIVKEGIGFGDIKLFSVLGLFFGLKGAFAVVFMSFLASFFVSIFLLVSKRKNRKEQIAFAPSILVGTLLSVVFLGA